MSFGVLQKSRLFAGPKPFPQPLKHKRYDAWWIHQDNMTLCISVEGDFFLESKLECVVFSEYLKAIELTDCRAKVCG